MRRSEGGSSANLTKSRLVSVKWRLSHALHHQSELRGVSRDHHSVIPFVVASGIIITLSLGDVKVYVFVIEY